MSEELARKGWIKDGVVVQPSTLKPLIDQLRMELMLEMEAEISRKVKEQVDAYCKSAFDTAGVDEGFHMIKEQSDEPTYDTRPNSPSIEEDKYVLSDPPVLRRGKSDGGKSNGWFASVK